MSRWAQFSEIGPAWILHRAAKPRPCADRRARYLSLYSRHAWCSYMWDLRTSLTILVCAQERVVSDCLAGPAASGCRCFPSPLVSALWDQAVRSIVPTPIEPAPRPL
jgi:hypothetical protein